MQNFEYANPTRILFGNDHYKKLPELIKEQTQNNKILLAFGGGSIFKNDVHKRSLKFLETLKS